ncbi:MAG TPA: GNAT family N-acetyltransferase [Usitatibacter sp.]|nr:GNAT family N-acetyltransferase [Usitatibacter sp.]
MNVREVQAHDFPRWLALWDSYNAFYGREGPTSLAAEVTDTTWRRFHDTNEPMHALVAERGGCLIGFAHYIFHRTTIALGPTCYLQDLFTRKDARGQGVARALIERVCERARQAGAARVYWHTHETNAPARALYDKVGENSGFIVYRIR